MQCRQDLITYQERDAPAADRLEEEVEAFFSQGEDEGEVKVARH